MYNKHNRLQLCNIRHASLQTSEYFCKNVAHAVSQNCRRIIKSVITTILSQHVSCSYIFLTMLSVLQKVIPFHIIDLKYHFICFSSSNPIMTGIKHLSRMDVKYIYKFKLIRLNIF